MIELHSDEEEVAGCGCVGPCEHVPVLHEEVLPPRRGAVRLWLLDRPGLVALARQRGLGILLVDGGHGVARARAR